MTRLKQFRKAAQLTQAELATLVKIKQPTLSKTEKTGIKTIDIAERYAKVLKCDPLELIEYQSGDAKMGKRVISNIELSSMIRGFTGAVIGSGYSLAIDRVLWAMRPAEVESIPLSNAEAASFAAIVIAQVEADNAE